MIKKSSPNFTNIWNNITTIKKGKFVENFITAICDYLYSEEY